MQITKSIAGTVRARIESADPMQLLSAFNCSGIQLYEITYIDELTLEITMPAGDLSDASAIADRRGDRFVSKDKRGLLYTVNKIAARPILVIGIFLLLILSVFIPTRILFVEVEGNQEVADRLILEYAGQAGVKFGALRSAVRSEKLKNTLLGGLPQLQWAGVNTRGCVAVITVTERDPQQQEPDLTPVSHVIAERDGVIHSITVSSGTPLCQVGQAVEEGQVLVSGYTDCGIAIKAQRAEAEIFALTNRNMVAKTLLFHSKRGSILGHERRYRIILGKKQINLWKDSGISDTTCVKMYKESYLTLPGGFTLPIGIGVEYRTYYDVLDLEATETSDVSWLEEWTNEYLLSHMICGQIIRYTANTVHENNTLQLSAKYECLEMIGIHRDEELINNYGEER